MRHFRRLVDALSVYMAVLATADLILWFTQEALVPSWTIAIFAYGYVIVLQILKGKHGEKIQNHHSQVA